jgi:rhodanese-related sulfurtransferase
MKSALPIIVFILLSCNLITGQVSDTAKFKSLIPADFLMTYLHTSKARLIDVREFFEYRKSRVKGAVNIPSSSNLEKSADTIPGNCALFLYCTSGFRSKRVARFFYDKGFTNLYSLEGGIVAWKKEGLGVDRKRLTKHD